MRLHFWTLIFLILLVTPLYSQNNKFEIKGKIIDEYGHLIENVSISILGDENSVVYSSEDGTFRILSPKGTYKFLFTHTFYETKEYIIDIPEQISKIERVVLKHKSIPLPEVVVSSERSLTTQNIESVKQEHSLIAGSTSVAIMNPKIQRLETIKEALTYEPGVMIQEFFGANDQPRINIRGSGIQSNPQRRGVYLLQDGIPINFADGSFIAGVIDPATSQYVEVFKGANALQYGAATLGGAINFSTRTGIYSSPLDVKVEAGSHDYFSLTAMGGKKYGKADIYSSLSLSRQNGFREFNKNKKLNFSTNFGYRFSENIDSRLYLNYSYINFDVPGPLTLGMIAENPKQINQGVKLPYSMGPDIRRDKPMRDVGLIRLANRTVFKLNKDNRLTASLYYQYADDRFAFPIVLSTQHSYNHDIGATLQWLFEKKKNRIMAGLIGSYGYIDRRGLINKDGKDSYMFSKNKLYASNITLYVEENYRLTDNISLIANLQTVYNERNSKDVFPNPDLRPWYSHSSHKYRYFYSENISMNQHYHTVNPRLGAIYNINGKKQVQIFGNISSSYEPPTFDELVGTAVTDNINTSPKKLFAIKLKKQSSVTAEVGIRSSLKRYSWNLSLYKSWVKDELLEVKDFVLGVKNTKNYPQTMHNGIEVGFSVTPIQGVISVKDEDKFTLRGMYNYSDFHFSTGEYKGKRLAGVARHFFAGALEYKYPKRLFAEINIECQPEQTPVDHQNTLMQPAYTVWGFKIGYEGLKQFTIYLEGKNIFNRFYASSYVINDQIHNPPIPFPDFTAKNMAFFMPGPTVAYYLGITYTL